MKRHLLLVDADPQSRRILEVSLRKAGYAVTGVGDATAALDRMVAALPDLVLSDTRLPGTDGFALVTAIRQRPAWSAVPVMFLSSDASVESKMRGLQQGVDEYLVKPIYIHEVVARVNLVLQRSERQQLERGDASEKTRFTGSLQQLGLVDAIRTMDKGRHSGVLHVVSGKERAALYFRDGALIDAEAGALRGKQAVEHALSWSEGTFEGEFREVRREDTIRTPIQTVLAESMRRVDDWSRLVEALPPLDHVLEVDAARLGARLDDVPDEANAILRSFDGRRSIREALEEGGADDIGRLRMIAKLWSDGLLADRSDGGAHATVSNAAPSFAPVTAAPSDERTDGQPRKQRTTADFEAPVSERTKRKTRDYDAPPRSPSHDANEDAQATTPGTLDAAELLVATAPGSVSAPEHVDDSDASDAGGEDAADVGDEPHEGDGAAPRTSLARMRRRRRRWKRLSLEGAPPAPAPPAPTPTPTPTAAPAPIADAPAPAPSVVHAAKATPATAPSTTPPPVRSPFSLVPPAADMAARLEVARARRSLAPPAAPPPPATQRPLAPVATRPIAPATNPAPGLSPASTPTSTFAHAVTRPEELGKTRIAGSETATLPSPAPPPPAGAPPRAAPGAIPTATQAQALAEPAPRVAPARAGELAVITSPELPRARAESGTASATVAATTAQPAHQVATATTATPATAMAAGVAAATPAHRTEPPERQSAWDIPQDEEPITIPPPPSSQRVLVWSAIVGVSVVATALVVRLVTSGGEVAAHATPHEAPAAEAPRETEEPQAAVAPPAPPEPTALAPAPAIAPAPPPVPAEAVVPVPVAPAPDAPAQAAPAVAEAAPAAPVAAPAEAAPVAAPIAPDATAQRDLLVQQARAFEAKGKPVKALSLYEQAIQLDPNASALLSHVALAYLNAGRNKDALDRAERAVRADATNSEGWIVLGAARDGLNDRKGAREAYRQCSEVGTGAYVIECKRMLR